MRKKYGEFESFANSERYKTEHCRQVVQDGLRALLIQKDTKHTNRCLTYQSCLRALLIQKDTKRTMRRFRNSRSLRALLIQKDTKL